MNKLILNFNSKDTKKIKNPKDFLGGKGSNLSEMGRMGLPVPPGFTISTKVCEIFYKNRKKLNLKLINQVKKELNDFLKERFRYYMKEKQIRFDIIEASISSFSLNKLFTTFEKAKCLNKIIHNQVGLDITSSYKRASNILESEMKNNKVEITNTTDPGIFRTDFEKNLFKKISEIKKYYSNVNNDENYEKSLSILAESKKEVFEFFDNVKVNEENETLRKNRLELINMLCKTFQNFINFQLLNTNNE